MTTDKEVINATKTIRDWCLGHSCRACPCRDTLCDAWGNLVDVADEIVARLE